MAEDRQNGRLVWLLEAQRTPVWARLLHRFLPGFAIQPQDRAELWISRADGKELPRIGWIADERRSGDFAVPHLLAWLRDGKQLSFVFREGLSTVGAR